MDDEYNNFLKSHIYKDESYASINPDNRSRGVVKQLLSPIFYSLRRIEYESVFHKILENICADLKSITNKKNLMDFVTPHIVESRFNTLIPKIANPPTGMFLDSTRGDYQPSILKKFPLIWEDNTADNVTINNIAFSAIANRLELKSKWPGFMIGHFAWGFSLNQIKPSDSDESIQ